MVARALVAVKKIAYAVVGIGLFILSLETLKASAASLGGLIADGLGVDTAISALGFGWGFAYVVLSGSPVAAIALTLFSAEVITEIQTFTMIAGSRLGASFVVLLIGFIYTLRGKSHRQSLEMGVLSLLTTYLIYAAAIPIGLFLLLSGVFAGVRLDLPPVLFDAIESLTGPVVALLVSVLRYALLVFVAGVGVMILAFNLFDRALPDLSQESPIRNLEAHIYRPAVMFALGAIITLLTLSVSVSLGLLVPLSAKGIARRENIIPYIMGANVTTFIDTLFATFLLDAPIAFTVVFVQMISVLVVCGAVFLLAYGRFERILLGTSRRVLATRRSLTIFMALILLAPIALLML